MVRTRRPKQEKPLVSLNAKVSEDLKNVIVEMSEKEERSVSYILERLLRSHQTISAELQKQPEKMAV